MASRFIDRMRLSWTVIGILLLGAMSYIIYSFIGTIVFGLFFYYATRPIYRRLHNHLRQASLAAAVSLLLLALPAMALVSYTATIVIDEVIKLTNGSLAQFSSAPVSAAQLSQLADIEQLLSIEPTAITAAQLRQVISSIASAGDVVSFIGVGLVHLFVMIALAFYLLRDDHKLSRWVRKRFDDDEGILDTYLTAVDNDFTNIFFGNILNAILTGTIGVISYSILNIFAPPGIIIPAAALVGLIAGVASLIPVVGMKLVYIPVALYLSVTVALTTQTGWWFVGAFLIISLIIVDTIPDLVLRPYVSGRSLHVGAVMIAYTFGPLLFGWYGVFLAPIILVLVVNFAYHVLPTLIRSKQISPYSIDPSIGVVDGNTEASFESQVGTYSDADTEETSKTVVSETTEQTDSL
jgi:predicted PurR-regulated permease PerM